MPDFLEEKRKEISQRLKELRPLVDEYHRLEAAEQALSGVGGNGRSTAPAPAPRRARSGRGKGTVTKSGRRWHTREVYNSSTSPFTTSRSSHSSFTVASIFDRAKSLISRP